ncbi:hypothetical protein SAMN05421780_10424 [Flexibacter flexilis DSM 6793]|uniref:Uncharacterized protein n=1 Tax=Flexibacter flexilis DSM 6793 TaxID=927664 RepID=A0A1I1HNR6_9BACT|nr:hypothetical protein SAMN05421780_10424 [Flexibacter flexilis DSM 6793]
MAVSAFWGLVSFLYKELKSRNLVCLANLCNLPLAPNFVFLIKNVGKISHLLTPIKFICYTNQRHFHLPKPLN